MNVLLVIISVILLVILGFNQLIKYKRTKAILRLEKSYEDIEMYFITNKIDLKNNYIEFLGIFKNLSVNPDFLDVQILLIQKLIADKKGILKDDKKWFENTLNSLPEDFKPLVKNFDYNANKIISLSLLKPDLVLFACKLIAKGLIKNGIMSAIRQVKNGYNYILKNDEAIMFSGSKLKFN